MTETEIPLKERIIGLGEARRWRTSEFLRTDLIPEEIDPEDGELELTQIAAVNFVNQFRDESFVEFESADVKTLTGYDAQAMREGGCGIACLQMVNLTLGSLGYSRQFPSVGALAIEALTLHKGDAKKDRETIRGDRVFDENGWHHNALLYLAREYGKVNQTFRYQNLTSWNQIANKCKEMVDKGNDVLALISVANSSWSHPDSSSVGTHLIIVNGFRFEKDRVTKIRVVDPGRSPKINEWLDIDNKIRKAFVTNKDGTGKAMFFATNREI